MSKFEERMENIFNVAPSNFDEESQEYLPAKQQISAIEKLDLDSDLKTDYENSRNNLEEIIEKGKNAIDDMLSIARESEHPRAYEVLATLIKNVADVNEKSIDLQKKIRAITNQKATTSETKIDKAIFVGSTTELAKMIKDMKKGE